MDSKLFVCDSVFFIFSSNSCEMNNELVSLKSRLFSRIFNYYLFQFVDLTDVSGAGLLGEMSVAEVS